MTDVHVYGELADERLIKEKTVCRDIVKEILDFGVNESQKYQIIKLIAENLENYQNMIKLCDVIDELATVDLGDILARKESVLIRLGAIDSTESER